MRVVVLTNGGADLFVDSLAQVESVTVAGVFVERGKKTARRPFEIFRRSLRYDGFWGTVGKAQQLAFGGETDGVAEIRAAAERAKAFEQQVRSLNIPFEHVDDFHEESFLDFIRSLSPDLGILYGTRIIREELFSIPRMGSINLHQGLAPFYRGGPTVFWELYNGETEIGITVHFVARHVDTGDIILQRRLPLDYDFHRYGVDFERFLADFRPTLVHPSVELMIDAVLKLASGEADRQPQDATLGRRYRLPIKREKDELRRRLRRRAKEAEKTAADASTSRGYSN